MNIETAIQFGGRPDGVAAMPPSQSWVRDAFVALFDLLCPGDEASPSPSATGRRSYNL